MKTPFVMYGVLALMVGFAATVAAAAKVTSGNSRDLVNALRRHDCDSAVNLAREAANSRNNNVALVVGRMPEEDVCVQPDGVAATGFLRSPRTQATTRLRSNVPRRSGSAKGSNKVTSVPVSSAPAMASPRPGVSSYSLEYVCTTRIAASRLLRESLPRAAAFMPNLGAAQLTFNPHGGVMQVRATLACGAWRGDDRN